MEILGDRERLASCVEVSEFEAIIRAVVGLLEIERGEDRVQTDREKPMEDLFSQLSAEPLMDQVNSLAEEGAKASDVVPLLRTFSRSLDSTRKTIQDRFVYYSRMANHRHNSPDACSRNSESNNYIWQPIELRQKQIRPFTGKGSRRGNPLRPKGGRFNGKLGGNFCSPGEPGIFGVVSDLQCWKTGSGVA